MSGHSHWATIKRGKEAEDKKRGKTFSKLSHLILLAAKERGGNVETNPKLKLLIEKAKAANMPKDNIERTIKRGIGELEGEKLEEVVFEAYGPGKTAIIIEGITDNKNRTLGEIKRILNLHNGKLADEGSVKWLFERKGVIIIDSKTNKEELELLAIEAGAEDIFRDNQSLYIYTKPDKLETVKNNLENKQIEIDSAFLDWIAKEEIKISEKDKQLCEKLFEALDNNDAVQEIYSNLK